MRRAALASWLVAVLCPACSVEYPDGALRCGTRADCPSGSWQCADSAERAGVRVCVRGGGLDSGTASPDAGAHDGDLRLDAEGRDAGASLPSGARTLGGADEDGVTGVAVDSAGNVYVVGTFAGALDFGREVFSTESSAGFVARYSPAGALAWARVLDGGLLGRARLHAIAVSGDRVYAAGSFETLVVHLEHPEELGGTSLTGASATEGLLASWALDGTGWRLTALGGRGNQEGLGVAAAGTDMEAHVCVAGSFTDELVCPNDGSPVVLSAAGGPDGFVVCLNESAGTCAGWPYGQASDDALLDVAIYDSGPEGLLVYAVGYVTPSATAPNEVLVVHRLTFPELAPLGSYSPPTPTARQRASAVSVSGPGVYVGGQYDGPLTLDMFMLEGGSRRAFLLRADHQLTTVDPATSFGGSGTMEGSAILDLAVDPSGGHVNAVGYYGGARPTGLPAGTPEVAGDRDPIYLRYDAALAAPTAVTWGLDWPSRASLDADRATGVAALAEGAWVGGVFGAANDSARITIELCGRPHTSNGNTDGFLVRVPCPP